MPKPWQGTRPTRRSDTRLLSPTIKCALSLWCSCRELRNLASGDAAVPGDRNQGDHGPSWGMISGATAYARTDARSRRWQDTPSRRVCWTARCMSTSFSLALLWKYRKSKFGIGTELQGTECPLVAYRVISRQRGTSVVFGAKRTLTGPRLQNADL